MSLAEQSRAGAPAGPDGLAGGVAWRVWDQRYRWHRPDGTAEDSIGETWRRVATALAAVERGEAARWAERFEQALDGFQFIPGGRILAGAGTRQRVTLFNCFVMGAIEDSMDGIFSALREGALTMQQGGGVGYDFSTLRPAGLTARATGNVASGPVPFMDVWDVTCRTLQSTGTRRGAMMATLRIDHPDIQAFIGSKRRPGRLSCFNLSVLVPDAFMDAVTQDADWPLVFPAHALRDTVDEGRVMRRWSGHESEVPCAVLGRVRARELWADLAAAAAETGEPGVLFIDRINRENNLWYRECLSATNPCGEVPLPHYGACDLGSINLAALVRRPFSPTAELDIEAMEALVPLAVRMLDNVFEISRFPLAAQVAQARGARRIGLGVTGLADALLMLGLHYDSDAARSLAGEVVRRLRDAAYRASVDLARERGHFPYFDRARYVRGAFVQRLPDDLRADIERYGIRNSHLVAIAPTGSISLLAGNVSSGIEPVFAFRYRRSIRETGGRDCVHPMEDHAFAQWQHLQNDGQVLPRHFVTAQELSPGAHLAMQAAVQPYVDGAIAKTVNLPAAQRPEGVAALFETAWRQGLKGCTVYRSRTGSVLTTGTEVALDASA